MCYCQHFVGLTQVGQGGGGEAERSFRSPLGSSPLIAGVEHTCVLIGPPGAFLALIGRPWAAFGTSWALLGRSCATFCDVFGSLGWSWGAFLRPWVAFGTSWALLGRFWVTSVTFLSWRDEGGGAFPMWDNRRGREQYIPHAL